MKKILSFLLILLLIVSMAACAPAEDEDPDNGNVDDDTGTPGNGDDTGDDEVEEGQYKDGTYEALGDKWDYGQESATIVIANGEITEVTLKRLTTEGQEVDYEMWKGEEIEGKLYPNLNQYREDMANAMIEAQSWDVDTISGATVSTENWRIAAKRALEEAKK